MRLKRNFYTQNALKIAPNLLGKILVRKYPSGKIVKYIITETEAYCGEKDKASHAFKGKTPRTKVMYEEGGLIYTYLVYGMYWMLAIEVNSKNNPEVVFIRCLDGFSGPGKVGKELKIDKSFYGEDLTKSKRIWIEDNLQRQNFTIKKAKRVGVNYAEEYAEKLWRFILVVKPKIWVKTGKKGLKTV